LDQPLDSRERIEGARHRPCAYAWSATSWATFLKAHWPQLAAIDFPTVEVWTKIGCNLMDALMHSPDSCMGKALHGKSFIIMDRDSTFHEASAAC
jgi:hypothetical protein